MTKKLIHENQRLKSIGQNYSDFEYPWIHFMSHNVSISRKNFVEAGYFDLNFVFHGYEDQEWLYKCCNNGLKVRFDEGIVVYHQYHEAEYIGGDTSKRIKRIAQLIFFSKHLRMLDNTEA